MIPSFDDQQFARLQEVANRLPFCFRQRLQCIFGKLINCHRFPSRFQDESEIADWDYIAGRKLKMVEMDDRHQRRALLHIAFIGRRRFVSLPFHCRNGGRCRD
jgi:hypothetical protein